MVDPQRLWNHVERLAAEPRPAGSEILENCRGYVAGHFEAAGCLVERRSFNVDDDWGNRVEGLPVETLAVPANGEALQAIRLSDHSPFWDAGFEALMITDTSFMRNPHYHRSSDTPQTLDPEFLALVARGCLTAVRRIVTGAESGEEIGFQTGE